MSMEPVTKVPLPLEPIKSNQVEDRRLWVGNLDLRINEYKLLKLVQKHGTIEKFDLLFHRSGPQAGQPRGYAFVTYKTIQDAKTAKDALHNLKVGAKNIIVRWAHSVTESDMDKPKPKIDIPALAGAKKEDKRISRETAIQAIEAKLKLMKESEEEFELNKPLNGSPVIHLYQKPENPKPSTSTRYHNRSGHYHNNKPYNRHKPRR
ncbi:probable RNA-binding protein 18 isoform X1 [Frieseomelitta varia]|uniref:probable RNA-binding protein 18 isoform X1 n=1 Tax=Frieseomelitta varia TaxID=561572 RepID=UPI001CB69D92|nr:probable RNA-binding protein 18 isoform X1 [Frieseomelitta varia]XP_043514567.1 probable RNA-binding protein 18 isoform X1 [Frieseomelitta varia]